MPELQETITELQTAWTQFQKTNDERLKQLLTRNAVDGLLEEKLKRIDDALATLQTEVTKGRRLTRGAGGDGRGDLTDEQLEHAKAFTLWAKKGANPDGLRDLQLKAMSVGSDPDGGFFVPVQTTGKMVSKIYETSPFRQYADSMTISAGTSVSGVNDLDEADSGWVGESETRATTDTPQTGKWKIDVHEQYAKPKATQTVLEDVEFDLESWLINKLTGKFMRQENYAFVVGDGVKRPRGLFAYDLATTADATRPWGTMQYIATGVSGGFPVLANRPQDKLVDLIGSLKADYRQGAVWVTNRAVMTLIRKFKDDQGNYIWTPGLIAGQPQTLLGYEVAEMEDVAAVGADSLSLGFGNLKETYLVVDRRGITTLRDPFSAKPFVEFYTTKRVGGGVINFEAFKILKFGTS